MFIRPIFFPLSGLMFILAGAMEIPALFDYFVHNKEWEAFQISAVVTLFTALALYVARDRDSSHFSLKHGYLFTVACWFLLPFFAALPFYWSTQEMTFTDAIFETISGLTTTGATILSGLENLPPGILLWRALLQWIGGIGIVVMAISIFPVLKTGGMQLFKLESSDTAGKVFPRIRDIAIGVFALYSGLTLICALIYFWEGMGIFDAIVHAMTTLSTGGFSTTDQSFAAFPDKGIIWTGSVFMFLGSVPFSLMLFSLKKRQWSLFFMDSQVQVYAAFVFIISLLCGYLYYKEAINLDFFTALTIATFNVISVITTTGYAIGDYSLWGAFAPVLFFFLTFVGGCSGSTAGGIKMFRFHVLWLSCLQQLRKLIYPNGVFLQKIDGKPLSNELSQSVLIYVFMLIISFAIIATSLSFTGLDFITALSGAATALSNVGPGLGSSIGPAGNFQSLPDSAKWILDIAMVLGRLEYVTIIVLLQASFWRY
jgi:trk system potassium uptake protein TrkH